MIEQAPEPDVSTLNYAAAHVEQKIVPRGVIYVCTVMVVLRLIDISAIIRSEGYGLWFNRDYTLLPHIVLLITAFFLIGSALSIIFRPNSLLRRFFLAWLWVYLAGVVSLHLTQFWPTWYAGYIEDEISTVWLVHGMIDLSTNALLPIALILFATRPATMTNAITFSSSH